PIWSRRNQPFSTRSLQRVGKEPTITSSGTALSLDWRSTELWYCVTGSVSNREMPSTISKRNRAMLSLSDRLRASARRAAWLGDELHSTTRGALGDRRSGWQGRPCSYGSDSPLSEEDRGLLDGIGAHHYRSSVPGDQQACR